MGTNENGAPIRDAINPCVANRGLEPDLAHDINQRVADLCRRVHVTA